MPFTRAERRALRRMRAQFHDDRDLFSTRELARLQFLRWLYRGGHMGTADRAVMPSC
jgi:hypothetical protein